MRFNFAGRSDNFTALRLVLSVLVLVSHSYALAGYPEPIFMARTLGNLAVHGFFAISGYLVTGSFQNAGPIQFTLRRILRIAPGLALGTLLGILLLKVFHGFPSNPVPGIYNGSIWTIYWEVAFYIVLLWAGSMAMLRPGLAGASYLAALLLICIYLRDPSTGATVVAPLASMFVGGVYLRLAFGDNLPPGLGLAAAVVLLALFAPGTSPAILGAGTWLHMPFAWGVTPEEIRYIAYLALFPTAILYVATRFPISLPLKQDYSYGIYVFAWPCQQAVIAVLNEAGVKPAPLLVLALAGSACGLLAVASWHLVERPVLSLKSWRPFALPPAAEPGAARPPAP